MQNKNSFPFTIFPQMPAERTPQTRQTPPAKKQRPKPTEGEPVQTAPPVKTEAAPPPKPTAEPQKKSGFTHEELINGFKMSVILGEPRSRSRITRK